jgi:ADP-ribosylglycohydrolase
MQRPRNELEDKLAGVLLGTAVGDAIGLPREGLSRRRARRLYGDPPLGHRLLFGRGMVSDDTEHACLVAQALLHAPNDSEQFARALGWGLRWWFLGLPAGVGKATARAAFKLWLGFSPTRSGVWSAGNGPAMRAALLGVCLGGDAEQLRAFVRACTRLTHTDPRAENGALLVAVAAWLASLHGPTGCTADRFLAAARNTLSTIDPAPEKLLDQMADHLQRDMPAHELADAMGLHRGVSGYIYHTVPLALYCWLRHPRDFQLAVEEIVCLGGDADTTAAITGALVGATLGSRGITSEWLGGLMEWPRTVAWMRSLAREQAVAFRGETKAASRKLPLYFWPGVLPRNLFFLLVVLAHGFRRLAPPY